MSELIDYTTQKNWDFMQFDGSTISGVLSSEGQARLKNRCQRVLESAQKTAESVCVLGYELRALRESGEWKFVVNPEDGMRFVYSSFEKFSEYAFGFGRTYTSNLTLLAEFCEKDENGRVQIKEHYRGFKQSGLVELAPLSEFERQQFTADMTIKDIRLCKKYMQTSNYIYQRARDGFNLLQSARLWQDMEKTLPSAQLEEVQIPTSGFSEPESIENDPDFAREFAEEEAQETFGQADEPFQDYELEDVQPLLISDEGEQAEEDPLSVYDHKPSEDLPRKSLNPKTYDIAARDKVRVFLKDYKNWTKRDSDDPHILGEYEYVFESQKVILIAREERRFTDMESKTYKTIVRFYWYSTDGDGVETEVLRSKLEKFVPLHLDELRKGEAK